MPLVTSEGTGVISFRTDPVGALVYLDGEEYPVSTPSAINNIPEGQHTYTLRKDGYLDFTGDASVSPGQLCCVEVNMSTSQEKGVCSTQPVPTYEVPAPVPTKPDYGLLALGLFAGLIVGLLLSNLFKKKEK
jgi:hypothetical protein